MSATSESVPKAGLPPSGLVVPLFQGQRWILISAPAWMASHSSRRRCSWNFSPGEAGAAFATAGDRAEVQRLNREIQALESALKAGGGAADTGGRARDNVRKAIAAVLEKLREGGPEERAFAEHLRTHLSLGHECLYSQPQGRIWG